MSYFSLALGYPIGYFHPYQARSTHSVRKKAWNPTIPAKTAKTVRGKHLEDESMPTETKPYNKEAVWAEIRARNDALAIELNKIPDEERNRIVEANYMGAD